MSQNQLEAKERLRSRMKQKRKELPQNLAEVFSKEITKKITLLDVVLSTPCICAYMPILNEVDTAFLLEWAFHQGKHVAVPKVDGDEMDFFYISKHQQMKTSTFHVPEPVEGKKLADETAVMLVPGVAFDKRGYRIGYGKGYYDKYLNTHKHFFTIGLAYDFQVVEQLQADSFDIPLNLIVTEKNIYTGADYGPFEAGK